MAHQKIIYQLTDKRIPAASGIGIVGDILERAGFSEQFRDMKLAEKRSRKQIDAGVVMTTFIALLCMGKPDFECVREFQNDAAYYQNALRLNKGFPSSATLRQRMDEIGSKLRTKLLDFNTELLRKNGVQPNPLKIGMVPVDMDVTPMDNSKTQKDIHYTSESGEEKVIRNRIVYEMTERTSLPDGQLLLIPEVDINMFWTNLGDSDKDIIALYHAHGECEQFHSEIKTDMGVERLPSGKFDTNELVLELTVLAYNILRMIGQEAVHQGNAPAKRFVSRKRVRTVIQNLIHFAGHVTQHARQLLLSISRSNAWADCFLALTRQFCFA